MVTFILQTNIDVAALIPLRLHQRRDLALFPRLKLFVQFGRCLNRELDNDGPLG